MRVSGRRYTADMDLGAAGLTAVQLPATLADANSAIVQRRSGKLRVQRKSTAPGVLNEWLAFSKDPVEILEAGRATARAAASALKDEPRLALARAFCSHAIEAYWSRIQHPYAEKWVLDNSLLTCPPSHLNQSTASFAKEIGEAAGLLDPIMAGYLMGGIYTAMLPDETRSRLGVYYTPPGLTRRLLRTATLAGVDWESCRVIDPACGGGAFLAPVASEIVSANRHLSSRQLVKTIADCVRGLEVDPFAAWASQVFLEAAVMDVCREAGERLPPVVTVCNSLLTEVDRDAYDLVIGNPPYGRVTLSPEVRARYQRSLYGHANLYGLFTDLAIQLARPGGVIAYVTPTSFLAGEYFKSLRNLLTAEAPPVNMDFVSVRKGVFDDALQETLLSTYQRSGRSVRATVHFLAPTGYHEIVVEPAGTFELPPRSGSPWLVPRAPDQESLIGVLQRMPCRLGDYGYEVSTGPLVWNRHKGQLAGRPSSGALPLVWAECVTSDGKFVFRADKKNHEPYFRPRHGDDWLISRKPCVLLQRTTAKEQNRRLIAAELPKRFLSLHGAVVIENHLNMIRPANGTPRVPPKVLTAFLNTEIVDRAFRCLSGSVAVSAYELEALPLPPPEALDDLIQLVEKGASRNAIENACSRLFLPPEHP